MTDASDRTDGPDHLFPLDVVPIGHHAVVPDLHRPVAAVVAAGEVVRWLTWPTAPLPQRAIEEAEAWPTADGVWVVYRSDGIDDVTRTAVHLDPDHVGAAVDFGDRRPVGADVGGLWLADPRDASGWMAHVGGDSDQDDSEELEALQASDLAWAEVGAFWPDPAAWTEPDDEVAHDEESLDDQDDQDDQDDRDDEDDQDDEESASAVMTAYQWSIGFADDRDGFEVGDDGDENDAEAPEPPSPTPPTDLVRIAPDGTRTTIRVDHLVEGVTVEADTLTVRYHPTGPELVPDGHGARDVVYRPREVMVDVSGGLPSRIDTEQLDSVAVEDPEDADAADWERSIEQREDRRAPWIERLDLAGVDGTRWPVVDRESVDRDRSVARLVAQLTALDRPGIVWSRGVDGPRRIRSDYRDVRVEVEGAFPATEVVVSFEHADVPFLRLRRRYRVFDDTGRPVDHGYLGVYLDEDIGSRHIPPRRSAVDGVLDI